MEFFILLILGSVRLNYVFTLYFKLKKRLEWKQFGILCVGRRSHIHVFFVLFSCYRELLKQGSGTKDKKFDITTYVSDKEEKPGCCGGS